MAFPAGRTAVSLLRYIVIPYQSIHREVFGVEKTDRTKEESAAKAAESEEKAGRCAEQDMGGAALDGLTALKIRLALTDTIDYRLPPVIGD